MNTNDTLFEIADEMINDVIFMDDDDLNLFNANRDKFEYNLEGITYEMMEAAEKAMRNVARKRRAEFLGELWKEDKYRIYLRLCANLGDDGWNVLCDGEPILPSPVFDSEEDANDSMARIDGIVRHLTALTPYILAKYPKCEELDVDFMVVSTFDDDYMSDDADFCHILWLKED